MHLAHLRLLFYTALLCLLTGLPLAAQEIHKNIIGEGQAVINNITPEQAKAQAVRTAMQDGIVKVLGTRVSSAAFAKDALFAGEFVQAISYGHVIQDTILVEEIQSVTTPDGKLTPVYYVKMEMDIQPESGEIDPAFKVDVKLNSNAFTAGEELVMTVRSTQPCYLTVLNIAADNSVYVLFPHPLHKDNRLTPEAPLQIPTDEEQRLGLHLRVYPLPGHQEDTEYIKVIATKDPVAFLDEVEEAEEVEIARGLKIMRFKNTDVALTELAQWLCTIPRNKRAEDLAPYVVVKKTD